MDSVDWILCAGIFLFAAWLLDTGLGRQALAQRRARRNYMFPFVPLIVLLVWLFPPVLVEVFLKPIKKGLAPQQVLLWDNLTMALSGVFVSVVILVYAHFSFVRGLKGFGLRCRGLFRDFGLACANLVAIWPLVVTMLLIVTWAGQLLQGQDYEIQAHPGLEQLMHSPQQSLKVVLLIMAIVIAPLSEELIFRGIIQNVIVAYTQKPWLAIGATAFVFAMVHGNPTHWPSLFILSLAIGYSYEKSGSLWRPIFIHALFNGITVVSNLFG